MLKLNHCNKHVCKVTWMGFHSAMVFYLGKRKMDLNSFRWVLFFLLVSVP